MKRVLIADDAMFMRMMLKEVLQKVDAQVVGEAKDGIEAVEKFRSLRPDIVTLDISMPGQDGISALKEIMVIDPRACVIMCSATGQAEKVEEALASGAVDYIVKPFNPEKVMTTLKRYL